jgi:hypothetical protein
MTTEREIASRLAAAMLQSDRFKDMDEMMILDRALILARMLILKTDDIAVESNYFPEKVV